MGYLERYMQTRRDEFMSNVSDEWRRRLECGEPISLQEYMNNRSNSYERTLAYPLLTDEALIHVARYTMANCSIRKPGAYTIPVTYDDLLLVLMPELLTRLEAANTKAAQRSSEEIARAESDARYHVDALDP